MNASLPIADDNGDRLIFEVVEQTHLDAMRLQLRDERDRAHRLAVLLETYHYSRCKPPDDVPMSRWCDVCDALDEWRASR